MRKALKRTPGSKNPVLCVDRFSKRTKSRKEARFVRRFLSWAFKFVLVILLLGILLYGTYYLVVVSGVFKVKNIEVSGTKSFVNPVDLESVAKERILGKNIFLVDKVALSDALKKTFQGAKDISVSKKFPSTICITVLERIPLALISNTKEGDYFMIDSDGYVLGLVDEERTNLPKIRYEGDIRVGYFVNKDLVPVYLELMAALEGEPVNVSSISFYPSYTKLYIDDGIEVLLGLDKDKKQSMEVVRSLLRQLMIEDKKVKKIDLRYDKVIVSY